MYIIIDKLFRNHKVQNWLITSFAIIIILYIIYQYKVVNFVFIFMALAIIVCIVIYRRPILGLCLSAVTELWLANYYLLGNYYLRIRVLLLPIVLLIVIARFATNRSTIKLDKVALTFVIIPVIMSVFVFVVGIGSNLDLKIIIRQLLLVLVAAFVVFLISVLIDNAAKLKIYLGTIFGALLVSCIIGILQVIFGEPFYAIKHFLISKPNLAVLTVYGEASGLALYSLPLAYQIVCVLPICISILVFNSRYMTRKRTIQLSFAFLIFCCALVMTLSRSAFFGIIVWLISWFIYRPIKYEFALAKKKLVPFLIFVIMIISLFSSAFEQIFSFKDESARDRYPLFIMGLKIFTLYPFGIGSSAQYNEYATENFDFFEDKSEVSSAAKRMAPHNQFLNTLLYWGFPALLLLIFFFIYKIRTLISILNKTHNKFIRTISYGLLGVSIAYIIHSFFHNAGPFLGDIFYWYIIGIIPALTNIVKKEVLSNEIEKEPKG